jgi:hypothetical protein
VTTYQLDLGQFEYEGGTLKFVVLCHRRGEKPQARTDSDRLLLSVAWVGRYWRYTQDHDIYLVEGKTRFRLAATLYDNARALNGEVSELVTAVMTIEEAKRRLESGNDWEVKIGLDDPLTLGPKARANIERFIKTIQEGG